MAEPRLTADQLEDIRERAIGSARSYDIFALLNDLERAQVRAEKAEALLAKHQEKLRLAKSILETYAHEGDAPITILDVEP